MVKSSWLVSKSPLTYLFFRSFFAFFHVREEISARRDHAEEQYHHVIDDRMYEDFTWIEQNLGEGYERALIDPWLAKAFVPLTGKHSYAIRPLRIQNPEHFERWREVIELLGSGEITAEWMRDKGV